MTVTRIEEGRVHWFEQLTGFSPDGGNGSLEALYDVVAALAVAVAATVGVRRYRSRRTGATGRDDSRAI